MSLFTSLVRPNQSFDPTPPRRIINPTAEAKPNQVLKLGTGGSAKSLNCSVSYDWRGYMKKRTKEKGARGTGSTISA